MTRRFGIMVFAALWVGVPSITAGMQPKPDVGARWARTIAFPASQVGGTTIFALVDGRNVLVRSGTSVAVLDGHSGSTLWSIAAVDGASANAGLVVLRRRGVVFAVGSRDAGVLWKHACDDPPYALALRDRVLTMCGGRSTVLSGRDGRLLAQHAMRAAGDRIQGVRALNDRYALIDTLFDGAWMGNSYTVVDSHDGAFRWSQTDFRLLDVTSTTISITPYPSMLPWAPLGTVVQRRLSDGVTLATQRYKVPAGSDPDARGFSNVSHAAAYVSAENDALYRFANTQRSNAVRLFDSATVAGVLGSAAFITLGDNRGPADATASELYLDRPAVGGGFVLRHIGSVTGATVDGEDEANSDGADRIAVHAGKRVAVSNASTITLYDEFGTATLRVQNPCAAAERHVLATRDTLFVLCAQRAPTITAYPL